MLKPLLGFLMVIQLVSTSIALFSHAAVMSRYSTVFEFIHAKGLKLNPEEREILFKWFKQLRTPNDLLIALSILGTLVTLGCIAKVPSTPNKVGENDSTTSRSRCC